MYSFIEKFNYKMLLWALPVLLFSISCGDDDDTTTEPTTSSAIAAFTSKVDDANFLKVKFTSTSKNATKFSWDFGDGSGTSTDENPEYTYAKEGTYTVKLTATGADDKASEKEQSITLTDPNAAQTLLSGTDSKTWKIVRTAASISVQPSDFSASWFSISEQQVAARPCLYGYEFIFKKDGAFEFKANGSVWLETDIKGTEGCADESELATIKKANDGTDIDISTWASSTSHTYAYDAAKKEIVMTGKGAFLGLPKGSGDGTKESAPQPFANATTYVVDKIVDGGDNPDTLVVDYLFDNAGSPSGKGSWRATLVSYKSASQEPALPELKPVAKFTATKDDKKVTFSSAGSVGASTYAWDFGDGNTSTDENPVHTYASFGEYTVKLVVTNDKGVKSDEVTEKVTLSAAVFSAAVLSNSSGKVWKLPVIDGAYKVGSGLGKGDFWSVPKSDLEGARSCQTDVEFTFVDGGTFKIDNKGNIYHEDIIGGDNKCKAETNLSSPFDGYKSADNYKFEVTEAAGGANAKVKVIGAGAYLGFLKAYNGGEVKSSDSALPAQVEYDVIEYTKSGNVETLVVSVVINSDGHAWTMTLTSTN